MLDPVLSVSECAERGLDVLCTVCWSDKLRSWPQLIYGKEYGATFLEKVHVILGAFQSMSISAIRPSFSVF